MTHRLRTISVSVLTVLCVAGGAGAANAATIYQYNPGVVWSGYSLGTAAGVDQWSTFKISWIPRTDTWIDDFCFNITTKESGDQVGSTTFNLNINYWSSNSGLALISASFYHWFGWNAWIPGEGTTNGSWHDFLANEATKSFSTTWTDSSSSSTENNDEVCFPISTDLERQLKMTMGTPYQFVVSVPASDKDDCTRDGGNPDKCLVYYNMTAPYSSQSWGFSHNAPPSADYNRNAMFSGRITGLAPGHPSTTEPTTGAIMPVYSSGSLGPDDDFSGANELCASKFGDTVAGGLCSGVGYLFIPSPQSIEYFWAQAESVKTRVPWSYMLEVKSLWEDTASVSYQFPKLTIPWNVFGASTSLVAVSSASYTRFVSSGTISTLRGVSTVGIYLMLIWYLWRRGRNVWHHLNGGVAVAD